jgi:3-phenylpropionate/trans-cinnamate dioxygenase ferredoxin reductase subunit
VNEISRNAGDPHAMEQARAAALARGVVVVGAGQAGGRAVEALRKQGFAGSITLVGDEDEHPYERPSLSKEMLHGQAAETIAWIQKPEFYAAQNITLHPGIPATAINRENHTLQLGNGEILPYGVLILATGARVRRLEIPGASEDTCHYLRSLADARALRARLVADSRVVIIGAGFIGLEAAAAAVKQGCAVTVIELGPLPLGRVAPAEVGAYYRDLHAAQGVRFLFSTQLSALRRRAGHVLIETAAGETIEADTVIAGIGVIPNAELAQAAGLAVERGIIVDEFGVTADPCIFAAGDVARHLNPIFGRHILLESWQNAQNQAIAIARNLAAETPPVPYAELPWFWSDQYDVNLQMFGLSEPGADSVLRGDISAKSWLLFQMKDGRMICAIGINAARDLRAARDLILMKASLQASELADTATPLIELARRHKREHALVG